MGYGEGGIYRRGTRWWIRYPGLVDGRPEQIREPAGRTATEEDARAFLARRVAEVEAAKNGLRGFTAPVARRVTIGELIEEHLKNKEARGLKSIRSMRSHSQPLLKRLGHIRAMALQDSDVSAYISDRRLDEVSDTTIDRELEVLRAVLRRAKATQKIFVAPEVPVLVPMHSNARQGFLEPEEFWRLHAAINDPDFKDYVEWFWSTAMRPKEIASLAWDDYDDRAKSVRLRAKDAKTKRDRVIPIVGPLVEIIERRKRARVDGCPFIFHHRGVRAAKAVGGLLDSMYDEWVRALQRAGLPTTIIPYDLRRSALRNGTKAGVPDQVLMRLGGWRTRSTFDRYRIVPDSELAEAIRLAGERSDRHKTKTEV